MTIKVYFSLPDLLEDTYQEALKDTFNKIKAQSLVEVPVDTGALKDSFFEEIEVEDIEAEATIGYNEDNKAWYAARVHELDFRHDAPTKKKYLSDPVERWLPRLPNRMRSLFKSLGKQRGG